MVFGALPVFAIVGALAADALLSGYSREDPNDPSRMATVMAVWEFEGGTLCRAFNLTDLLPHRASLRLRFRLDETDVERCRRDFEAYDAREGWARTLPGRDVGYVGYGFELESPAPDLRVMVHRSSGDATWTRTRYRVDEGDQIFDLETRGAGNGSGLGPLMGGFVGLVLWLGWALRWGWKAWQRRGATP